MTVTVVLLLSRSGKACESQRDVKHCLQSVIALGLTVVLLQSWRDRVFGAWSSSPRRPPAHERAHGAAGERAMCMRSH